MRYLYIALIAILVSSVFIFALQNGASVTISFLSLSATLPLALLVILVYASGVVTGGSVLTVLRSWIRGAGRR